ncbi:synaptonemal complex protein 1-like [Clytia hemisphaerica]|uniref:synaptonemal complex protein 1-like n=1 Tax=Clytia hemisphaerica TaxID=252671 RepID=UPI0034D63788
MIEPDFIDEEQIPLLHREDNFDDVYDDNIVNETSFAKHDDIIIQNEATQAELRLREKHLDEKEKRVNALERVFQVEISSEERSKFRLVNDVLQYEKSPGEYTNVTKSNGEFLAESTLRSRLGAHLAQRLLGIETSKAAKSRFKSMLKKLPTEIEMEDLTPQRLEEVLREVVSVATNTDLDTREFDGIDNALTRMKGELLNNTSKLSEIDKHIEREQKKLKDIDEDATLEDHRKKIQDRLKDLQQERKIRLEIASQNRKELTSQIARIRDTLYELCEDDLSLREKVKLVFREHGLTITAVLTAVGLLISTIITSLAGSGSAGKPSTPSKNPNTIKEWVKNKLKALARLSLLQVSTYGCSLPLSQR